MDESKDRGEDSPREIYRESFYKIFSDEKVSLFSFSLLFLSLARPVIDDILLFVELRLFVHASSFSIMPSILAGSWLNYDENVNCNERI